MAINTDRISGKRGALVWAGTTIPFTKITPAVERTLGDTTDSGDYVTDQDMIGKTQVPIAYQLSLTVEGRYRLATTMAEIIEDLFSSDTQILLTITLDTTVLSGGPFYWGTGLFDVASFRSDIPVEEVVAWTAELKSWGGFTPNSPTSNP